MSKKIIHIDGMHCSACEVIIERKLKKVQGISKVKVNRRKKHAEVSFDKDVSITELQDALPKEYTVSTEPLAPKKRWLDIGVSLLIILGIYLLLKNFDLLPKTFDFADNLSYGFIFVIGLIASTSTCLAVSGGLLLALAAKHNDQHPNLTKRQKFDPHIYFNIGRLVGYAVLGGLIGWLGSLFTLSNFANGIITILASLLMILIGLQLLHFLPFLDRFHIRPPKLISHWIHDKSESEKSKYSHTGAAIFGALTFFLPCGFTQALQLYVLAQGDPIIGALTMFAFALGTLPTLASIGAISSIVSGKIQQHFMTFSGILVIILGLLSIQPGLALVGVNTDIWQLMGMSAQNSDEEPVVAELVDGVQIANMKVEGLSYSPHKFIVKEGIPVEWRIDGTLAEGCGQVITVPDLEVTEYLKTDEPTIIKFTPDKIGELEFSCSMGMTTPGAMFDVVS